MIPFNIGDVVNYTGQDPIWLSIKQPHIISEIQYCGQGDFEYATTIGAWFTNKDFTLVRKADKRSYKALDKSLDDEY